MGKKPEKEGEVRIKGEARSEFEIVKTVKNIAEDTFEGSTWSTRINCSTYYYYY